MTKLMFQNIDRFISPICSTYADKESTDKVIFIASDRSHDFYQHATIQEFDRFITVRRTFILLPTNTSLQDYNTKYWEF